MEHMVRYKSDHTLIMVQIFDSTYRRKKRRKKPFHFEIAWLLDDSCESLVRSAWEGSSGFLFEARLGSVARELTSWSKDLLDNLARQISSVEENFKNIAA